MSLARSLAGAPRTRPEGAKLGAEGRRWHSIGALLLLLVGAALTSCAATDGGPPHLIVGESVDSSLQTLAEETWAEFLTTFQGRADCFGDVRLEAAGSLDSRAVYDPQTATVTVRVPATAALLQGALVHEWAHHIEFQCDEQQALRPAFLAAQGLPPDTPWRPAGVAEAAVNSGAWADIPSEQYAEAAVVLVLGRRPLLTRAHVTGEAVGVLELWASGQDLPGGEGE